MGNWKISVEERIKAIRLEQRKINEIAAVEYLNHGNTRRFRKLWKMVCSMEFEIDQLQILIGARQEPRTIGFISNDVPIPNDYDAPPDTDDEDNEPFDDEEDAPRGNEIYCSRKEPRRW